MDTWETALKNTSNSVVSAIARVAELRQLDKVKASAYLLKDNKLISFSPEVTAGLVLDTYNTASDLNMTIRDIAPDYLVIVVPMLLNFNGTQDSVIVLDMESKDQQVFMFFRIAELLGNIACNITEITWYVMANIDKKKDDKSAVLGPLVDIFGTGRILALPPVEDITIKPEAAIIKIA